MTKFQRASNTAISIQKHVESVFMHKKSRTFEKLGFSCIISDSDEVLQAWYFSSQRLFTRTSLSRKFSLEPKSLQVWTVEKSLKVLIGHGKQNPDLEHHVIHLVNSAEESIIRLKLACQCQGCIDKSLSPLGESFCGLDRNGSKSLQLHAVWRSH